MEIQPDINFREPEQESSLLFQTPNPGQSQFPWYDGTIQSIQVAAMVDPNPSLNIYESDLPVGMVIPTVDAVGWANHRNVDVRPRLVEKSGEIRLIDSGAMISATKRLPTDKLDDSVRLVAVNGSKINTYGVRELEVKIGRKKYTIQAVICDIEQDILGMDFIYKYRLGFEWDPYTQSELFIVDKKAKIKSILQTVT